MSKKLRQVTDNIHGTIYLSDFESEMIATPYFFRLHDIYQNSTVYMSFPSNRTKRYEHSLGTMEIASEMLCSALSNATEEVRNDIFECLNKFYSTIVQHIVNHANNISVSYLSEEAKRNISNIKRVKGSDILSQINNNVINAISNGMIPDAAFDDFQLSENNHISAGLTPMNMFLYRCLLQSVRIVALFHDVGHPPMSHIMEEVLAKIYCEAVSHKGDAMWNQKHIEECINSLEYYIKDNPEEKDDVKSKELKINTIYKERIVPKRAELHEKVGISLLHSALSDVISDLMKKIRSQHIKKEEILYDSALSIYYLMIAEMSMAIITDDPDNDNICLSMHKIIDGIFDSDRLDYIARDSKNSGVDWGSIPYKRIINHSKFIKHDESIKAFLIAYPKKISEDISDVLVTRYKMYARINFHHRCMKNAASLQRAVLELAKDYLMANDGEESSMSYENGICPEIRILWTSLNFSIGTRSNKIIRWNDSWLITSLHNAFVKISDDETLIENHKELYECLEEVLLNKKKYYTLIKRGSDSMYLVDEVLKKANINNNRLKMLWLKEYNTYLLKEAPTQGRGISDKNILDEQYLNAKESFLRIDMFEKLFQTKDLNLLERIAPPNQISVEKIINETLEQEKSVSISDYKVMQNQAKYKLGIPDREKNIFDSIYLYSRDGNTDKMDYTLLKEQLVSLSNSTPAYFIYFAPNDAAANVEELSKTMIDKISTAIAEKVQERYDELFPEDK